jgi:hypothetical protein
MKKLLLTFAFAFSFDASAATLNLGSGEIVTLQPNVATTVTCGGGGAAGGGAIGVSCDGPKAAFDQLMQLCIRSFSPGDCAKKQWAPFKSSYPQCVYAGVEICAKQCIRSFSPGDCSTICQ